MGIMELPKNIQTSRFHSEDAMEKGDGTMEQSIEPVSTLAD